ncbi:MAG TPA: phosphorylase [Candidatus Binatia bacterium]|nr:phosphorylase [Candidatus Binatia bacterium]
MLGIVVSLSWELKSLTRQTIPVGSCRSIADNVIVALSGIGAERAYAAGSRLIAEGATALVSWGFAAALDPRLNAGSLILPEHIIGASGGVHAVSAEWHRRLCQSLSSQRAVHTNALVESDNIVRTPDEKRALAKRTQAIATDMESAAQARLASEHRLPFVALRAIIDTASTDIPEKLLKALDSEGDISVWKLVTRGCIRPPDWPKVLQLGIQFNAAQRTLKKTRKLVLDSPRF